VGGISGRLLGPITSPSNPPSLKHPLPPLPSGVAKVYGTQGEFRRLAPPPPIKTGGPLPVRKIFFYGLAADRQEYSFAKIDLYIIFLTNVNKQ